MYLSDKLSLIGRLLYAFKKNIVRIFAINVLIIVSLTVIFEAITLCRRITNEYNQSHLSDCYFWKPMDVADEPSADFNCEKSVMSRVSTENPTFVMNVQLVIDGQMFYASNFFSGYEKKYQNITSGSSEFEIGIYNQKEDWFPSSIFMKEDDLLGQLPLQEKELIVDDYLLRVYGIADANGIIGKQISVIVNDEVLIKDYTLTGVYRDKIYEIREKGSFWRTHYEHILVHLASEEISVTGDVRYYFSDFEKAYQYISNQNDINHTLLMASDNLDLYIRVNQYSKSVGMLIVLVSISAIVLLAINELFTIIIFNRDNRRFCIVLSALGASHRDTVGIIVGEYLFTILLSLIFGTFISIGIDVVLRMIMQGF